MIIDTNTLDISKTYVVLEIGTGIVAGIIQGLQHKIYKNIEPSKLASHALAVLNDGKDWYVYECHAQWKGTKKYLVSEYNKTNKNNLIVFPFELDINRLEYYIKFNPSYSVMQLAKDTEERLIGIKIPNSSGMVCSEYVMACAKSFDLCYKLKQPYMFITPADLQSIS